MSTSRQFLTTNRANHASDAHVIRMINQFANLSTQKDVIDLRGLVVDDEQDEEDDDPQHSQAQNLIPLIQANPPPQPDASSFRIGPDRSQRARNAAIYAEVLRTRGSLLLAQKIMEVKYAKIPGLDHYFEEAVKSFTDPSSNIQFVDRWKSLSRPAERYCISQ